MNTTPNDAAENYTLSADHTPAHQGKEVVREPTRAAHDTPKPKRISIGSKRAMVLSVLLTRGTRGLNCFEAVTACHDYVLRSTVSELCADFGLEIPRELEQVPGYGGTRRIPCVRYRLSDADRRKVRELLELEAEAAA